jgi:hypothetical protein
VSYRAWRCSLVPTTHQRPTGQAFQGALGDVEDALIDRAKQAVKARFPLLAPPDALTALGVERQLPQGPGESTTAYAARLQGAWLLWPWAGTPYGLLRAFADAGYPNVVLAQPRGARQFTLDANGALVISSGVASADPFWSKFTVLFPAPLPAAWAGVVPAITSTDAAYIFDTIRRWKPGHATWDRIIFQTSGKVWGFPVSQVWGAATGTWGGTETIWLPSRTWGLPATQTWGAATGKWGELVALTA